METLLLWGMGLLAVSALIVAIELFLPTGGILGFVAFIVAIAGVIAFWRYETLWGVLSLAFVIVMVPACFHFALRIMPYTPVGRSLILGSIDPENDENIARHSEPQDLTPLVGKEGVVLAELRPVGEVRVDGRRYEGHAEEGIIASGARVVVIDADADRLTVRAV